MDQKRRVPIVFSLFILLAHLSFLTDVAAQFGWGSGGPPFPFNSPPLPPQPKQGNPTGSDPPASGLAKKFLVPQNQARKNVGAGLPPFKWSDKLRNYAQSYANTRRGDCALQHSNGPYGENIFWGGGNSWTPQDAVKAWVSEKQYYHYGSNSCDPGQECGHYTQVVWKNSVRLGCASVICNSGDTFITCNYDPPGNYIGEKPY